MSYVKPIKREILVSKILLFRNDFFKFIDYINAKGEGMEFPEANYIRFYNESIINNEDRTLRHTMSMDTLIEGGVFTYRDRQAGTLVLSKVVYDLLVFLDVSRNKELTSAKFGSLRSQMLEVVTNIKNSEVGSDAYKEYMQLFHEQLGIVLTTVRENIGVLKRSIASVAEKYEHLDRGDQAQNIEELYKSALRLSDSYVQPCLEFINPDLQLVGTLNFVEAVDSLKEWFRLDGDFATANAIGYKLTAITAYYKDIQQLSGELQRFLYNLSEDRLYFMAIEKRFNRLVETLADFRHDGGKHFNLNHNLGSIKDMTCFDGLGSHNMGYAKLFNRNPDKSITHFKDYYEEVCDKPVKQRLTVSDVRTPPSKKAIERTDYIMEMVARIAIPDDIDDVYLFIHQHLLKRITAYSLVDTLHGLKFFMPMLAKKTVVQSKERRCIEDEKYYLEYITLTYKKDRENGH